MARAGQIKRGNVIKWRDQLWRVLESQQTFTGKHGAYFQLRLNNLDDGHVETVRFSTGENVEKAFLQFARMQYLYQDAPSYVFMNAETTEQAHIDADLLTEVLPYLAYNAEVQVQFYKDRPVAIDLPPSVILEVIKTEPAVRGDTATAVTKPAELDTGLVVKVPGHVKIGDKVQVDTRTGEFLGRA